MALAISHSGNSYKINGCWSWQGGGRDEQAVKTLCDTIIIERCHYTFDQTQNVQH